jgi:hypothetical protein
LIDINLTKCTLDNVETVPSVRVVRVNSARDRTELRGVSVEVVAGTPSLDLCELIDMTGVSQVSSTQWITVLERI